jgi:hypothetical protein
MTWRIGHRDGGVGRREQGMSGDPILAALARLEAGQTSLRVDLMARIDRLQDAVNPSARRADH